MYGLLLAITTKGVALGVTVLNPFDDHARRGTAAARRGAGVAVLAAAGARDGPLKRFGPLKAALTILSPLTRA